MIDQSIMRRICAAIRVVHQRWDLPRKEVRNRTKERCIVLKKDGTPSRKYTVAYRCEGCGELVEKVEIHHIEAVGSLPKTPAELMAWLKRLFCESDGLQGLCHKCHTATDSYGGKKKKKKGRK